MVIQQNVSLRPYTTFGIDVKAQYLVEASTEDELREALNFQQQEGLALMILGGGSNLLLTRDVEGFVLRNQLKGIHSEMISDDHIRVEAAAGENWHLFVQHCIANNWGGLENLSLIPGNVGASPMQNIGAYGIEIKDVFHSLRALKLSDGSIHTFNAKDCAFGYRESVFKRVLRGQYIILSVSYLLTRRNHVLNTSYGAISQELEKMGIHNPSIADVSNAVMAIRRSKLPDPAQIGNAGSFFKNPVVENSLVEKIRSNYPNVVAYPAGEQHSKLAAGWLIETAGWKGYRNGDAGVHALQALVLVNYGTATGAQIWQLSQQIIDDVHTKFGVELEREVNVY
ncbi:MAG: UDP-N-acetylmuramate dehydrogenase [Bacteroidota bacterium]|jgi:UDP-N-acetylmuramate dehydrogenase